ncbi:MAG: M13 family metallopeptidase [Vicinamibacterales bacterium]
MKNTRARRRLGEGGRLLLVASTLIATAAVNLAQGPAASPGASIPGIDAAGMDVSVRPQDDFFRYVNGRWVDTTPIPADQSTYGTFAILRERSQEAVRTIIEEAGRAQSAPGSNTQKIGDLYKSFMDEARIELQGVSPFAGELAQIATIKESKDLPAAFAHEARIGTRLPFSVNVGADQRNSESYVVQIGQSGLGMPNRDYYLRTDGKFPDTRKAYATYIARMFALANQPDPEGAAARIVALETRLAELQWDNARNRDRNATYNKIGVSSLQAATPHFDWQAYFSALPAGASDHVKEVVVRQPDYLKAVDAILADTPVETWKEYLKFGLISEYADGLSTPFADSRFEFTGKVLGGRQQQPPRWKRGVTEVEQSLGEPVGRVYVERHFKPEAKARMDALIRNLLAAFTVGIDELEWMSPSTKVEAKAKLAKYRLKIAYPDQWRDYSALEVKAGDNVGNKMRLRQFQDADTWARLGKPVEKWRWSFTPQTVNASYSATNNEITFPAGILQPPFFAMDADDAINYGAIGAVIGHEVSHGFDDQGRKSDGDGNLRDWWTADDAKQFEERATRLGAQYESYTPLPGMKINGRQTMGENIGDLSGIAVALRAYHLSLNGKPAPVIGGFTGDQRFFLGYAQIWRFKSRDEALRNQLLTDAHSPGFYRAFVPLTNIDAWYAAFNVKPGDKLYRAPADRVKIW